MAESAHRLMAFVLGLTWIIVPTVGLIRSDGFLAVPSRNDAANCFGIFVAIVVMGLAVWNPIGLIWPWRDYVWGLPALAVGLATLNGMELIGLWGDERRAD